MDVKYCTIALNGTASGEVDLEDCEILGLIIPALDTTTLTFTVSATSGGTFVALQSKALAALTISSGAGAIAVSSDDLSGLRGYRFVKIVAGSAQTSLARTFTWLLKSRGR
jgi:hypothetical protein